MRNLVTHLIALLIGLGIGYFFWGKNSDTNSEKKIEIVLPEISKFENKILNVYEPDTVSKDSSLIAINNLISIAQSNPKTLLKSMVSSYAIDFASIKQILKTTNVDSAIDNKLSLRIYPSLWPLDKTGTKFKFTLILARENENRKVELGGTKMGGNDKIPDGYIYEYIIPCPPRCQDEDFYTCDEWKAKLALINSDFSNIPCKTQK